MLLFLTLFIKIEVMVIFIMVFNDKLTTINDTYLIPITIDSTFNMSSYLR